MVDYTLPLEQLPDPLPIEVLRKPFDVTITPPGSKSITCRAYVLAALAQGESRIIRPLRADDTEHLLRALCTLGAEARWISGEGHDGEDVLIKGVGGRFPRGGNLYMGDGGAPTRFMIACACLAAEPVVIDASQRMRERPIAEGVEMLRQLGAKIEYVEAEGRLPVRVVPIKELSNGDLAIGKTLSSQSISAILLLGSLLSDGLRLTLQEPVTSQGYVDLTLGLLRLWGVESQCCHFENTADANAVRTVEIKPQPIPPKEFVIETDASGTTYWTMAAALGPDKSVVRIQGLGRWSAQPDAMFAQHILPKFGAGVVFTRRGLSVRPRGRLRQESMFAMYGMPDAAVTLGAASARANHLVKMIGLRTLRVKETDRIAALANELCRVGCGVETGEDWIEITPARAASGSGSSSLRSSDPASVIIETYNDHRMAMAFAVLGLVRPGISIRNPACVKKSYPTFWKDFAKLYQ
ncbi:MAG: 3-phosphoshikimate 1-carboxyvinyltransferase [Phycisphaerales bacterium]|nr:3-phosphoshikimate 1-carboxyvinyltransferase [Phycisphaerales bacterium]MCI0629226.1 3-phosphoshikimate 1-carboxyvinyltransferase [Phycisphaerales bacterium]MCI0677181.1 3-phosphoshikimate 1-carboxyvinyltransferase [Phycisphaerales bacterium]